MNGITMTLADGTELKDLKINGTSYISSTKIDESILISKNLKKVILTMPIEEKEEGEEDNTEENTNDEKPKTITLYNLKCARIWEYNNETWFNLVEKTTDELFKEKIQAQIDYIAMMTDVEV